MMKIRSKKLYEYLESSGALKDGQKGLEHAKKAYRRKYQSDWKKQNKDIRTEIRFKLNNHQYFELKCKGLETGHTPTSFTKQLVLDILFKTIFIPNKSILEEIRQSIGISISLLQQKNKYGGVSEWEIDQHLFKALNMLDSYLKAK